MAWRTEKRRGTRVNFTVSIEVSARFRDTDAMGHINNAVYLSYLEVARQEYWKRCTDLRDYAKVPFILAHVCIDYRSAAKVEEILQVQVSTTWVSERSFGMKYRVVEKSTQRLVAEAETVQVTYDYVTDKVIPVPEELRRQFEALEGRVLPRSKV